MWLLPEYLFFMWRFQLTDCFFNISLTTKWTLLIHFHGTKLQELSTFLLYWIRVTWILCSVMDFYCENCFKMAVSHLSLWQDQKIDLAELRFLYELHEEGSLLPWDLSQFQVVALHLRSWWNVNWPVSTSTVHSASQGPGLIAQLLPLVAV